MLSPIRREPIVPIRREPIIPIRMCFSCVDIDADAESGSRDPAGPSLSAAAQTYRRPRHTMLAFTEPLLGGAQTMSKGATQLSYIRRLITEAALATARAALQRG